jgi:hypothetical protein
MPRRRSERAQRRIAERTRRNALALEAAIAGEEESSRPKLARARYVSVLEFLLGRGAITERQLAAGERLARDFRIAGDMPHVTMKYDVRLETPTKGSLAFRPDPGAAQVDGRRRFERAVQELGPYLSAVAIHACVLDQPLATWTRPRDGPALLRLALDVLGDHYRLEPEERAA